MQSRAVATAEASAPVAPNDDSRLRLVPRLLLIVAAVAIVTAGQALTSRNIDQRLGQLAPIVRWLHVRAVYGDHPRTVVAAAMLLIAGGALFALATLRQHAHLVIWDRTLPRVDAWRTWRTAPAAALIAAGLVVAAYLNIRLLADDYAPSLIWWFLLSIALIGRGVAISPLRAGRTISLAPALWELALLAAALAFFAIVNIRDLESWRYTAIGDEYAFFSYAKGLEQGVLHANVFSQYGVYNQRPVGTSEFQAASMAIFGVDSFGWRLATVIALAGTIPAVYLVARELFDRRVAAFSTLIFAVSHYLISYAHTTYDNVFAIFPFTWCLALAVGGLRRASPSWLYAAGVVGGLGFYTFPTARMAPIVLVLFLVTLGPRAWKPSLLVPLGLGLLIAGLPLFATDKWDAISVSSGRTVFGFRPDHAEVGVRILQNIPRSWLSWSYNPNPGHFVSGSFLDPLSAILLVLGLGFGLSRAGEQPYRLLAIWLGITVLFAGIFSPYPRSPYDRLHLSLPVVSIYAGIAVSVLVARVAEIAPDPRRAAIVAAVMAFAALAPLMAWLNLYRFLVDSPEVVPTSEERLVLGGLAQPGCNDRKSLAIMREPRPLLDPALAAYGNKDNVSTRAYRDVAGNSDYAQYACIVVSQTRGATATPPPAESGQAIVQRLKDDYAFEQRGVMSSKVYGTEAVVLERR